METIEAFDACFVSTYRLLDFQSALAAFDLSVHTGLNPVSEQAWIKVVKLAQTLIKCPKLLAVAPIVLERLM